MYRYIVISTSSSRPYRCRTSCETDTTAEFCKRSKLVAALISTAFSWQYQLMYTDATALSLIFHFDIHVITPTTFVGAGSAKITLELQSVAKSASIRSNHSLATIIMAARTITSCQLVQLMANISCACPYNFVFYLFIFFHF